MPNEVRQEILSRIFYTKYEIKSYKERSEANKLLLLSLYLSKIGTTYLYLSALKNFWLLITIFAAIFMA